MPVAHAALELLLRDRVVYGRGRVAELPHLVREADGRHVFIVTEPGVVASGVAERVRDVVVEAGLTAHVHRDLEPEPGAAAIARGSHALAMFGTNQTVVVGLGGGTAMVSARVIALHAINGGDVLALGGGSVDLFPGLAVVAVPTAPGSGGEAAAAGVIADAETGRKAVVPLASVRPRVALLDPELTTGLPRDRTAATGIETLATAIERLVSSESDPFAEAMAVQVIRTVASWLPVAVDDGSHMEARGQLLFASHLAGLADGRGPGGGLAVAIARAIGERGPMPAGAALAAVLPAVLAFHAGRPGLRDRELALVAVALGAASPADDWAAAARSGVDALRALLDRIALHPTLDQVGIADADIPAIARRAIEDPSAASSPRAADATDIEAILRSAGG